MASTEEAQATALPWWEKLAKNWMGTRLAHEAVALNKLNEQGKLVRQLVRKTQQGTLGQVSDGDIEGEDMIHVGDMTINQNIPANGTSPVRVAGSDGLKKALVSAALVAGGAGAGVGIPWLAGLFDQPVAVETPIYTDANTRYELSIKPDK